MTIDLDTLLRLMPAGGARHLKGDLAQQLRDRIIRTKRVKTGHKRSLPLQRARKYDRDITER
jgi:hypothetical protein